MKFEIFIEIDEKKLNFTEDLIKFTKASIDATSHRSLETIRDVFIAEDEKNQDILHRKFLDHTKIETFVDKKDLGQECRDLEIDKETWSNLKYWKK